MSRFRNLRRPIDDRREDGFTLLEVIVAMGLFALVTAGTLPMVLSAIRAGLVAKLDTGAKALTQERFEYMRSLPYHLDNSASPGLDLLDQYYPAQSTRAAATIAANSFTSAPSGWISESNTSVASRTAAGYRLPSEPAAGAFYRVRHVPTGTDGSYTLFTTVQFLAPDRTPYPQSKFTTYRSIDAAGVPVKDGTDSPPTTLVGVTVTAYWTAGNITKQYDSFTQISEGAAADALINAQARVTALQVSGSLDADRTLALRAGIVNADASLSTVAGASASATGAVAAITPNLTNVTPAIGASETYSAEPDGFVADGNAAAQALVDVSDTVATFGNTSYSNVAAKVVATPPSVSQPCASDGSLCATGSLNANGGATLGFRNKPSRPVNDRLALLAASTDSPVYIPTVSGSASMVSGHGWIESTPATSSGHSVTSGVQARLKAGALGTDGTLRILPTSFAPNGLVQLTLTSASLTCTATGASSTTPLPSYSATLRYWKHNTATGTGAYQNVTLTLGSTDPLPALNPANLADRVQVGVASDGTPLYLGEYIESWGSLTSSAAAGAGRVANNGNSVSSNIESLITIRTVPVRSTDPTSGITIKVGAMSCLAEDNR